MFQTEFLGTEQKLTYFLLRISPFPSVLLALPMNNFNFSHFGKFCSINDLLLMKDIGYLNKKLNKKHITAPYYGVSFSRLNDSQMLRYEYSYLTNSCKKFVRSFKNTHFEAENFSAFNHQTWIHKYEIKSLMMLRLMPVFTSHKNSQIFKMGDCPIWIFGNNQV